MSGASEQANGQASGCCDLHCGFHSALQSEIRHRMKNPHEGIPSFDTCFYHLLKLSPFVRLTIHISVLPSFTQIDVPVPREKVFPTIFIVNKSDRGQSSDVFWRSDCVHVPELSFQWHSVMLLMLFCSNSANVSEIQLACDG